MALSTSPQSGTAEHQWLSLATPARHRDNPMQTRQVRIQIENHVLAILGLVGEDVDRPRVRLAATKYAETFFQLTRSYRQPSAHAPIVTYSQDLQSGIVVLLDLRFSSLCEHRLMPFSGKAHICFQSNEETGPGPHLPLITAIVDSVSRRLQTPGKFTEELAKAVTERTRTTKVCVVVASSPCFCISEESWPGTVSEQMFCSGLGFLDSDPEMFKLVQHASGAKPLSVPS